MNTQTNVWELENDKQKQASGEINRLYEMARENKSTYARNVLKKCFDGNWQDIKNKMETEGSVWYVWYMDGVNNYITRHINHR